MAALVVEARTGEIVRGFGARSKLDASGLLVRLATAPDVVVAIPVYNGGETVRECILSVVNHTHGRRIVVIDDASPDQETETILEELAADYGIELHRNDENLGYTRTVNRAIALADGSDVVLLNSDTVVGPQWVERLRWTAYSLSNVASVSAASDNAGAMAMPEPGVANDWPDELSWTDTARYVAHSVQTLSLESPTGHGFCLYLRRDAIEAVGLFDETNFPRGYGEENDWSMRALGAGLQNLMSPRVFVRHAQGISFGDKRSALIADARTIVDALHPSYRPLVGEWMRSDAMGALRETFRDVRTRALTADTRPRTLYVIHASGGGTPETNRDLMDGLLEIQESYLLVVSEKLVRLERWRGGSGAEVLRWKPDEQFSLRDTWRPDYAAVVADILQRFTIELIHIRHLINQPLTTVPEVARLMNVPVILSTHDFYYICPSVHLLDEHHTFCGGVCTPGAGPCTLPTPFTRGAPDLKHNWIEEWKKRAGSVLSTARHVIATTPSAASLYAKNYPAHEHKLRLIEHGRDLSMNWGALRAGRDRRPGPLRVAVPAKWDPHKGTEWVSRLIELTGDRVEWHVLGGGAEFAGEGAVIHGRYTRAGMTEVFDQIDPDFVGLFSIWPETYSHTLTEAWALGVPVLATDLGAVADRIRAHGGGEVFDVAAPESAADYILERAAELSAGNLTHRSVPRRSIRSRLSMAQDYGALYVETRENLRMPTVGYIVRGEAGLHTSSTHVRLRRRMRSARVKGIRFRGIDVGDLLAGVDKSEYAAILVQRDAIPSELAEEFIALCRARGIPFAIEVDDDLVSPHARERLVAGGYDPDALDSLLHLINGASRVFVSTGVLVERMSKVTSGVTLVPNELDTKLWDASIPSDPEVTPSGRAEVVYMGTRTHTEDLELLRAVFDGLTTSAGVPIRLNVIGVTDDDDGWFNRVDIPRGHTQYPRFVPWLREASLQWQLAVAPLVDTEFNAAKSDLKFLEYSLLGLPTIASDVSAYAGLGEHGLTLVPNEVDAWRSAIIEVFDNLAAAKVRAAVAEAYVRSKRTIASGNATSEWVQALDDLVYSATL